MRRSTFLLLASAVTVAFGFQLSSDNAFAQDPTNTTATYGAWVVRCDRRNKEPTCEMLQTLAAQNRQQVIAQVAIGRLPKAETPRAVLQVPLGVDLTKPATLQLGEKAQFQGRYFVCSANFCFSEIELPKTAADEIAVAKKASIRFFLQGKDLTVPVSTEGMAAAFKVAVATS